MRRRKRSGRLPSPALGLTLIGLLCSACSASADQGDAGQPAPAPPPAIVVEWDPVAVVDTAAARAAGVNAVPLDQGDSLLFVWPRPIEPVWNMVGVGYDLELHALDETGRVLATTTMRACPHPHDVDDCPTYDGPAESAWFVEYRPDTP